MKNNIQNLISSFEKIKQIDDNFEFWSARDLQKLLGYSKWENFSNTIEKAKISCKEAGNKINKQFPEVRKPIISGKGGTQYVTDYNLSRYACYLIAQNGDPKKQEIAFAQAYFAVQTRKQEIIEQKLIDLDRLRARKKLTTTEKEFQELAFERGVNGSGIGRIRSKGDTILFGGKTTQDMKNKLGVKSGPLADVLPTITLKAKDLATEVINHNMKHKSLYGENQITDEHLQNNTGVRKYLNDSGIKPEELPGEEDLKKIERKIKSDVKKGNNNQ
ncbi:MAG: DNA damage-inducible protein D [Candidatus Gracilibacteria bacterium]